MDCIVYGAGFFGLHVTELLLAAGIRPRCLFDRDVKKQGRRWMGVPVREPEPHLAEGCRIIIAHASPQVTENIRTDLRARGFHNIEPVYDFANKEENATIFSGQIIPLYADVCALQRAKKEIARADEIFCDTESRNVFRAIIQGLERRSFFGVPAKPISKQYLLPEISYREDEVFCDIGAGPGVEFLKSVQDAAIPFRDFYLFDPCPTVSDEVRLTTDRRIVFCEKAIGAQCGTVRVKNYWDMNACIAADGEIEAECIPLDMIPFEKQPTFMKIDVEGWERKVLQGMKQLIAENRPILAMACYHKIEDFWELPLLFAQMPRVRFFLRSYMGVHETVLYVVPEERLL
ncbi:hypothetical protein TAMA11512_21990 [Selenomonas sp. TAMA-11512]|uniref:FkbM family methyltransferase n=1 Tax=Selenomonas sp. TAMA-11512 TaxID=3095337 RepID=UPI003091327C|nr:hypothetical protein TAMA11512_21990 [Selenomonas sp. TAMA-11512]